ncbi:hypothetical protein JCM11641_001309 [Rhodosporidiobolus odoratus]
MASPSAVASLRLKHTSSTSNPNSTSSRPLPDQGNHGEFIAFKASMRLPISPVFASKGDNAYPGCDGGMDGVREVLAGWVMRYLPPLRAVLLSFSPTPRFLHPSASFPAAASPFEATSNKVRDPASYLSTPPPDNDDADENGPEGSEQVRLKTLPMVLGSGFTLAEVEWEGVGWRPKIGMKLVGTPTLSTPSHISLLLHNLFNASIPSSHIPSDQYEFDPECDVPSIVLERRHAAVPLKKLTEQVKEKAEEKAEEEIVEGIEGVEKEDVHVEDGEEMDEEEKEREGEEEEEEESWAEKGWWVDRKTREPLGGKEGRIEFTLVGLTTSNSLLTSTGSLLSNPFTPSALSALHSTTTHLHPSSSRPILTKGKKRSFEDDSSSSSSNSDSDSEPETDHDDDDRVGTGIPASSMVKGRGGGVPEVTPAPVSESESESGGSESSRSPSPAPPPPPPVVKKKENKEGRKSKKVKTA